MEKKFETLVDLYKNSLAFRAAMKTLHKAHSDYLNHLDSKSYARWNDENVDFCHGILFTVYSLGCIDAEDYDFFVCVLLRYRSYNF